MVLVVVFDKIACQRVVILSSESKSKRKEAILFKKNLLTHLETFITLWWIKITRHKLWCYIWWTEIHNANVHRT